MIGLEASTVLDLNYFLLPEGQKFRNLATGNLFWLGSCKQHPKVCSGLKRDVDFLWHRIYVPIMAGKWVLNVLSCAYFGTACFHR